MRLYLDRVFVLAALVSGCSGSESGPLQAQGGLPGTGGNASGGAVTPSGGAKANAGGASSNGGTVASSAGGMGNNNGGSTATSNGGGSSATGGSSAQGGNQTAGGAATSGGASTKGGASSSGGKATVGGTGSGGKASGGTSAGGVAAGGKANGGTTAAGGKASGGSASGGASSGGSATGGASLGGSTGACAAPTPGSKGTNPLFTDQYTADPAPLVFNCKFYINCGHDEGSTGFVMREWFILSSSNMVDWTKKVGMTLSTFKWATANAWAGQMVQKGGKFYWYVPVADSKGAMAIGVAVSNSPEGPFTDAIGKPLVDDDFEISKMGYADAGKTPYTIDPTVYVDSDGSAYLQYGGFWRMVSAKLGSDMISLTEWKEDTPANYFEAPFLIKRNNTWYEIYAAGNANPTTIDYATSSNYNGPWTRRGTVLPKMTTLSGQDGATNHAGVAEFAGQWYIVYHRSNGPNGGGTYKREVAVEKLNFNSDGTIQQVTLTDGLSF